MALMKFWIKKGYKKISRHYLMQPSSVIKRKDFHGNGRIFIIAISPTSTITTRTTTTLTTTSTSTAATAAKKSF